MLIDKDNPSYNSEVQEAVWNTAANLVPLEITLPLIPEKLHKPCIDLYNFTKDILNDLYENADEYGITSTENNAVIFYFWHLVFMFKKFQFVENSHFAGFFISSHEYKKSRKNDVCVATELMYTRYGFKVTFEDTVKITNTHYPGMMKAVFELLTSAYMNYNVNCTQYLLTCDFRALVNYRRTYVDTLAKLNSKSRKIAEQIVDFGAGIGVKPTKNTYYNRVEFKTKSKIVFIIDVYGKKELKINIGFAELDGEAFKMIEQVIDTYNDAGEFTEYLRKNLKKCTNCIQDCIKKDNLAELFGKKTLVCQAYIRIFSPNEQELNNIYRLIELRAMVVKAGVSEVFYPGNG